MLLQFHFLSFFHPISVMWKAKLLNCPLCNWLQSFLTSKNSPQRSILKHLHSTYFLFLLMARDQVSRSQFSVMWRRVFWYIYRNIQQISVAERYKAWICGRSLAGILGSNPAGIWMFASSECYVLSGRGRCVGLITRPEESYEMRCVWAWSRSPIRGGHDSETDRKRHKKKKIGIFGEKNCCPIVQGAILPNFIFCWPCIPV